VLVCCFIYSCPVKTVFFFHTLFGQRQRAENVTHTTRVTPDSSDLFVCLLGFRVPPLVCLFVHLGLTSALLHLHNEFFLAMVFKGCRPRSLFPRFSPISPMPAASGTCLSLLLYLSVCIGGYTEKTDKYSCLIYTLKLIFWE